MNVRILITEHIQERGILWFKDYMALCLYHPESGYYTAKKQVFGDSGDFVTACELGEVFTHALAQHFSSYFQEHPHAYFLEVGPGRGQFAKIFLERLEALNALPAAYYCDEISPARKVEQQTRLKDPPIPVHWGLPTHDWEGIIFANEVLDAMPIHLFAFMDERFCEAAVIEKSGQLILEWLPPSASLAPYENHLRSLCPSNHYVSEINTDMAPWLKRLTTHFTAGKCYVIDYGFLEREYYHPQRAMGTLTCHRAHQAHFDPLAHPGEDDITAHVDFSTLHRIAEECGFSCSGFGSQQRFLLEAGLLKVIHQPPTPKEQAQVHTLTHPAHMGESIKVCVLSKNTSSFSVSQGGADRRVVIHN